MERLERGTYLGGQQIAAVLGKHPYMSIGDVYARSIWGEDPVDPDSPHIRRGRIVEPGLVEEARVIDDVPRERLLRDVFLADGDLPFFAGTLDAIALNDAGEPDTIYEVTSTNRYVAKLWGESGSEDAAAYKWLQAQWYMGLSGARRARIFCLVVDNDELREYTVPRSESSIAEMRAVGEEFWLDHVMCREPPEPSKFAIAETSAIETSAILNRLFRAAPDGKEIAVTPEIRAARAAYVQARDDEKSAEDRKAAAAAQLKLIMQDATSVRWDEGRISWSQPRAPTTKVDLDAVIDELATRYKIPPEEVKGVKKQMSRTKPGARVMNVY